MNYFPKPAKPQLPGSIGEKITIDAVVIIQRSTPVPTLKGICYSHYHVLKDSAGNLYKYKGSTFYPLHSQVCIKATIKGFVPCDDHGSLAIIIKAPKAVPDIRVSPMSKV